MKRTVSNPVKFSPIEKGDELALRLSLWHQGDRYGTEEVDSHSKIAGKIADGGRNLFAKSRMEDSFDREFERSADLHGGAQALFRHDHR